MHLLHAMLRTDETLRSAVNELSEKIYGNSATAGLLLDFNPAWLLASRAEEAGLDPEWFTRSPYLPGEWMYVNLGVHSVELPDLRRRFDSSEFFTGSLFGRSFDERLQPYMLRIIAKESGGNEDNRILRRELVRTAREARIPTLVETHDPVRLLVKPGEGATSNAGLNGTIGGFLCDSNTSQVFAVTCGHVVPQGRAVMDSHGMLIGRCVHACEPLPLPHGQICHSACGTMTELDAAFISLGAAVNTLNTATHVAQYVVNGDIVEMEGATSGKGRYQVGAAVVNYEIGGACWEGLIQTHAVISGGLLPVAFHVAGSSPPAGGDSGAWLIRNGTEWAGMVVAGNALFGYALAATSVVRHSKSRFGLDLVL